MSLHEVVIQGTWSIGEDESRLLSLALIRGLIAEGKQGPWVSAYPGEFRVGWFVEVPSVADVCSGVADGLADYEAGRVEPVPDRDGGVVTARGCELTDDPQTELEYTELNVADGVKLVGETRHVIGWLRDAGLTDLALAVADAHWSKKADECGSPIAEQWIHGDAS